MARVSSLLPVVALGLCVWAQPIATFDRVDALRQLVPRLVPAVAQHLVHDDEPAFQKYCAAMGARRLRDALWSLSDVARADSREGMDPPVRVLRAYQMRIAIALAEQFQIPEYRREIEFLQGLEASAALQVRHLRNERSKIVADATMSPLQKVRHYLRLVAAFDSLGDSRTALLTQMEAAREVLKLGRRDEHKRLLLASRDRGRRLGETLLMCQLLGELGATYRGLGQFDSMAIAYDEALQIARRCRLPEQAARILRFQATHHAAEGRLALATDLVLESHRVCREFGGEDIEIRFVLSTIDFFAELGAWDVVERLERRCAPMLRRAAEWQSDYVVDLYDVRARKQRARILAVRGDIAAADRVFRALEQTVRRNQPRVGYAVHLSDWAQCLAEAGKWRDAAEVSRAGLTHCDSLHVPEHAPQLAVVRARSLLELRHLDEAAEALEDARTRIAARAYPNRVLQVQVDVLWARLLDLRGRRAEARNEMRDTMRRVRAWVGQMDSGVQGYLSLSAMGEVRRAWHDLMRATPREGYEFELRWRALGELLGRERSRSFLAAPEGQEAPLPAAGTAHLVYYLRADSVVRWTATSSGVSRETVAATDSITRWVRSAQLELEVPEGSVQGASAELASLLHRLYRHLIPQGALEGGGARERLYVTADGVLATLPFATLNAGGPMGYRPIAALTEIAYVRSIDGAPRNAAIGRASILMDPEPSSEMRRLYPGMRRLARTGSEAEAALNAWPGARLMQDREATKATVLESWSQAPRIYVAAHLVADPGRPLMDFVPMAVPAEGGSAGDGYLEVTDVRELDLSGCELAILMTCASGAPSVVAQRIGPSLGDAFLDAGARVAVQTFWRIDDSHAHPVMRRFFEEWVDNGHDPVRALNAATRAIRHDPAFRHPGRWGTWFVELKGIPTSGRGPAPGQKVAEGVS